MGDCLFLFRFGVSHLLVTTTGPLRTSTSRHSCRVPTGFRIASSNPGLVLNHKTTTDSCLINSKEATDCDSYLWLFTITTCCGPTIADS